MNNSSFNFSMNASEELRTLIVENPDLPLLCFAGEDAWRGNFSYEQADIYGCAVKTLTLYGDYWCDEDDYKEELVDDMADVEEYKNLSDEAFYKIIDEKIEKTEFVKAIVFYVG